MVDGWGEEGGGGGGEEDQKQTCPENNAMRGLSLLLVLFLVQRALFLGIRSCFFLSNEHLILRFKFEKGSV